MLNEKESKAEMVEKYRDSVEFLMRYESFLEAKSGSAVTQTYNNGNMETTIKFPVYDSTLLGFINDASQTVFMNRNYHYLYSQYRIKHMDAAGEHKLIESVDIMHMEILGDILSAYVFKGMTRGAVWAEGVKNGVYLAILKKAKEVIEFNSVPLDEQGRV
ncbi:MAG: hypothetical protein K6G07_01795 [Lachnospiraceae bacterium]|nr:hypothetical protein [Lachnospiraceae bacterium]